MCRPFLWPSPLRPGDLRTRRRRNQAGSWRPRHSSADRTLRRHLPARTCWHCFPGCQCRPCRRYPNHDVWTLCVFKSRIHRKKRAVDERRKVPELKKKGMEISPRDLYVQESWMKWKINVQRLISSQKDLGQFPQNIKLQKKISTKQ